MSDRTAHPPTGADVSPAEARRVMRASVVGTAIEFYDFTLYGFAAVLVFGPQFFPASDPVAGQLGALATFAVGFVVRPLGAVVGGDRKSTRLNSSHVKISYAVFCLKKK